MSGTTASSAPIADREIVCTRVLAAPRELVFQAYADPQRLERWWGPNGFTNTFSEFEFRPGGRWNFVMHAPDGAEYPNHSVFDEIVPPERIVFRHLDEMHQFQMTILLADEAGGTRMTWRMLHQTVEENEKMKSFVPGAMEQNFDKLEAELARMTTPQ